MNGPTQYRRGDRVSLVHTTAPDTGLRPGDEGTVQLAAPGGDIVTVDWDQTGSRQTLLLGNPGGDALRPAPEPQHEDAGDTTAAWSLALDRIETIGWSDGAEAGGRWARNALAGSDLAVSAAIARRLLTDIDANDPRVLDALSAPTASPDDTAPEWYVGDRPGFDVTLPPWEALSTRRREAMIRVYRAGFHGRAAAHLRRRCRAITAEAGHGQDLTHLHPGGLADGDAGVFGADWDLYLPDWDRPDAAPEEEMRYQVGYLGILVGSSTEPASAAFTPQVARAIVVAMADIRTSDLSLLLTRGVPETDAVRYLDQHHPQMRFDDDVLVYDTPLEDGGRRRLRIAPDEHGRYVIPRIDQQWRWDAVDPRWCDRLIGEIPEPDPLPDLVSLTHTPDAQVPHTRLVISKVPPLPTRTGLAHFGLLELDERTVGLLHIDVDSADLTWVWLGDRFGASQFGAYARACRRRGHPITADQVMKMLFGETALAGLVADAERDGRTVARLVGPVGDVTDIVQVWPVPRGDTARQRALARIASNAPETADGVWQLWTGTTWHQSPATPASPAPQIPENLDELNREQLVDVAASNGILLDPDMDDAQLRTALRAHA